MLLAYARVEWGYRILLVVLGCGGPAGSRHTQEPACLYTYLGPVALGGGVTRWSPVGLVIGLRAYSL